MNSKHFIDQPCLLRMPVWRAGQGPGPANSHVLELKSRLICSPSGACERRSRLAGSGLAVVRHKSVQSACIGPFAALARWRCAPTPVSMVLPRMSFKYHRPPRQPSLHWLICGSRCVKRFAADGRERACILFFSHPEGVRGLDFY